MLFLLLLSSCAVLVKTELRQNLNRDDFFNQHFTGFCLYDPETEEYLYEWNADKYFTMASNTKLLTFYAGLKILGDSIPGLVYAVEEDTLYFTSTGDPSFLHPAISAQPTLALLQRSNLPLVYVPQDFQDSKFAPGWSWEDYQYYFQPERNEFPIYANSISFIYDSANSSHKVYPSFFADFAEMPKQTGIPNRLKLANIFSYTPDTSRSAYRNRVPFITSDELVVKLLEDTLGREVQIKIDHEFTQADTVYSIPSKQFYAYMLKVSDNMNAEQLQYLCATQLNKPLNSSLIRTKILDDEFNHLTDTPIWRDGSGLSRYNLATPRTMIEVLRKINEEMPIKELKQVLAIGGVDGTLKNYYQSNDSDPYIFAKTGTLSNNHNLTGIIRVDSGRHLFFSFMNNNYTSSSRPVKEKMEEVLLSIKQRF